MKIFLHTLKTLPFLTVLFIILGGCSLRIGNYPLLPALFLIPIYYWLIFRPDWLPLWSLFGIGIFYDALMGSELGFSSLLLVLSGLIGYYIRPILSSQHFFLIWGIFCCYSLCYLMIYGLLFSGGWALLFSWAYGIVLYPLVAWSLSHLHLRLQSYV
ncbi:MAG: rod shape-determining protein MreD [Alphaproteobacteria bacterium]|nr:rod shape-determining protein MreD [Alphaproteobacteria bacterium]